MFSLKKKIIFRIQNARVRFYDFISFLSSLVILIKVLGRILLEKSLTFYTGKTLESSAGMTVLFRAFPFSFSI